MDIWRAGDDRPRPARGTAVTIGAYDGVHRGHREVIGRVRALAQDEGLESAVVTFDRHPASVVRPESAPKLLTDLEQKLELLAETSVDHALVVHFDASRAAESAEEFVQEILVDALNAKRIVVGADFHFGNGRRGNVALLTEMGASLGFGVQGIDLVGIDGHAAAEAERVSSTGIRRALLDGDLDLANEALGRPYEIRGLVGRGDQRGRDWGFPTANVAVPDDILLPRDGIYAGWYERPDGSVHAAAISLGRRPTIYEQQPFSLLEAHLLDFEGDLYGERARVRFVAWLRGDERFDSVDALVEQIGRDCDAARTVLAS